MQCGDNSHQENKMRCNKWRGTLHNVSKVVCGKKKKSNQEQAVIFPQNTFIHSFPTKSYKYLSYKTMFFFSQNTMKFSIKQSYLPWKKKRETSFIYPSKLYETSSDI